MSSEITRRLFLRNGVAVSTTAAMVVAPVVAEALEGPADFTAIPADIVEKIKAWQTAHREAVRATSAYSASLNVKPIVKAECDRCFYAMVAANELVPPAREAMIFALWRVA